MGAFIHPMAEVEAGVQLGDGTRIWRNAHIRTGAVIGRNCIIGEGAYIGPGVIVGDNCKIQNYACVYEPAILGAGVFIGPHAVLTNDRYPRAVNPDGTLKAATDWHAEGVRIDEGAAVGTHATVIAGVHIGAWALVGAGAVVTKDVQARATMLGVPARERPEVKDDTD